MAKALTKGSRITGPQRATLASQYAKRYAAGESIRTIADSAGRSFGFVHGVLTEAGVTLRGRGGATRGAKKAPAQKQ
ncbi:MAG TPA: helix-turn-helix domain-containing protein [Propionibacteriaceae bacterium]